MKKQVLTLFIIFFVSACSDSAIVTTYDKKLAQEKISCMRLVVFPPDREISKTLEAQYSFSKECAFSLNISKKSGIVCNSTQNVSRKTLSTFPSSYLKMALKKDRTLVYSYYIDLKDSVSSSDITRAFSRLQNDLILE